MASSFVVKEHVIDASHIREFARATSRSQDEVLKLAIKQYIPKDNQDPRPGDITIISSHANGFPKELYEALWEDILAKSRHHGFKIRSIWIADVAWQGQSGFLNADKVGNDPSWNDPARDILHMINHFRMPRPIFGVAHSFGCCILANIALFHPRLFQSLILFDPVISRFASAPLPLQSTPAAGSVNRNDIWPSREAAVASFRKSSFYKAWDPRVLDSWIRYGIVSTPTPLYPDEHGKVTLATTKHQEVFTFFRPSWDAVDPTGRTVLQRDLVPDIALVDSADYGRYPVYRAEGANTLVRLPNLRPSVLYLFGDQSYLSAAGLRKEKMETTGVGVSGSGGAARGRVAEVILSGGHLFPMETPGVCAEHAVDWIAKEMERWRQEEREYEEWTRKSEREKTTMGKKWFEVFPKRARSPKL